MKTQNRFQFPAISLAILLVFVVISCEVDKDENKPVVATNEVTAINSTEALCGGTITSDGGDTITGRGVCWSTDPNPTIDDNKTRNGAGGGSYASQMTGLNPNTSYYVRAYATNSAGTGYGSAMSFTTLEGGSGAIVFNPNITYGSMTDIDGNTYKTVTIGTQTWMAENLKVTKYNDGTYIPNVTDATAWSELTTGALCDYDNTPSNSETYGKLYNWYAVNIHNYWYALNTYKLCPTGWHVPSDAEWITLEKYLIANGYNYDGTTTGNKIAKAMASSSGWESFSEEGTIGNNDYPEKQNASGFTALPGGQCYYFNGSFRFVGGGGYWWSSTKYGDKPDYWRLTNGSSYTYYGCDNARAGYSVRCVRD